MSADDGGHALSFAEVFVRLAEDATARRALSTMLAEAPLGAYFFELAPVTKAVVDRPFEAVLVDGRALTHAAPDPDAFAEHFARAPKDHVVAFANLGRDAHLVVPAPRADRAHYGHLASFVRGAPAEQVDAFFAEVARAATARLSSAPLWISTAGLGVAWLHVRLDSRPKYYRHAAYHAPPR